MEIASARRKPSALVSRLMRAPQVQLLHMAERIWPDVGFRAVESGDGAVVSVNGRRCVMLASNDYLGLRWDPRVIEASVRAVRELGSGASSSRLVAGATPLHAALEEELADWLGREGALVFTTGYQANVGALSALLGRHDYAICDAGVHASILDGCRLGGARLR